MANNDTGNALVAVIKLGVDALILLLDITNEVAVASLDVSITSVLVAETAVVN